jgi:alkaline phosphatase
MLKRRKQADEPTRQKPLRLWPGVVIVVLQWLARFVAPIFGFETYTTIYWIHGGVFGGGLAILVWWGFFSRAPRSERLGAIILMVIAMFATWLILHESVATGNYGFQFFIYAIPVLSLAFVFWAVNSRHLSDGLRRAAMVATILAACGVFALVRSNNLASELAADFAWRWTETPEDRLQSLDIRFYTAPTNTKLFPLVVRKDVKNIILMIGDGMGLTQINATRIHAVGPDGFLHIDRMPVVGFIRTHAADDLITDSASSATAYATGVKTNNRLISVTPTGERLYTVLEGARDRDKSTGLIATSAITSATPACFAAHVKSRRNDRKIAKHLIENRVNVILGGGKYFFVPDPADTKNEHPNLIERGTNMGYTFIENREELMNVETDYLLGLFHMESLSTFDPEPSIAEMTQKAIDILSKDTDGFFLMVEGSQIDSACHSNEPAYTIRQMLLFDQAIEVAMNYAIADQNTLVIITADHETGGMSINGGDLDGSELKCRWTSIGHTGVNVPIFAYGPHAEMFMGLHDNTYVGFSIASLFKISPFPQVLSSSEDSFD